MKPPQPAAWEDGMSVAMVVTWVFAGLLVGSLARVLVTGGPG